MDVKTRFQCNYNTRYRKHGTRRGLLRKLSIPVACVTPRLLFCFCVSALQCPTIALWS